MSEIVSDPLADGGIAGFAARFRAGTQTSEALTRAFLDRIDALDGRLKAWEHVARDSALATARAMDALIRAGVDLGPLMGVPVGVKDLLSVDGMPVTAGSNLPVTEVIGTEGPVVQSLRKAGCVILGKLRTVEFALGITGVSNARGCPVNPWDADVERIPGGSSSGSAVATAAGMCAFAIGTDTGGSVRVPAAMNGIFGLKTSTGRLSIAGCFPLAPHLDTVGLLTRSAADAAVIWAVITGTAPVEPAALDGLRLGRPTIHDADPLAPVIAAQLGRARADLTAAGARILPVDLPEATERADYFPRVLPACLVATLVGVMGEPRAREGRALMDPVIAKRFDAGFEVPGWLLLQLEARRRASIARVRERLDGIDALMLPTTPDIAIAIADLDDPETGMRMAMGMTRYTQTGNYLDQCGISIPMPREGSDLPGGLQIICAHGQDERALAIGLALEAIWGRPPLPDMSGFVALD